MVADYFHLVPRIVADEKYFDISEAEIERALNESGEFALEAAHEMDDEGEQVVVTLEIRLRNAGHLRWTASQKAD